MSTDLLFGQFATLATAPEGIARLRGLILQLAVQGKLGTQDAKDEPASVLLEKIGKEKERLVKERKIKKDKPFKMSDSEEPLGLLPNTWVWTRLSEIGHINPRNNDVADEEDVSFIPMTLIPVAYKKPAQQEIKKWGEIKAGFTHFADNDVVMAKITPCFQNGKSVVLNNLKNGVGAGTTELHVFRSIKNLMNPEYVLLFLKTPEFLETGIRRMTGSAGQKRVPNEYFSETPFPLPPLAEQHRIVAKVDRLMAHCDQLEARQQQERSSCLKLGIATLAGLQNAGNPEEFERQCAQVYDAFDLILDCPENVVVLRRSILQLAIKGRLVRQEPGDEPAEKLVERIRKEKMRLVEGGMIKHEKPFKPIREEEKSYSIPNQWAWIRLGEAVESMANGIYKPGVFYSDDGIACLRMYNINSGKINFEKLKRMVLNDQEMRQYLLKYGDLLVNRVNSRELVGKAAVIPILTEPVIFESKNIRVRFDTDILLPDFVNILFQTKEVWRVWQGNAKQTCGQASVSQPQIAGICTPLPPLAEQHRIVAKVDALMALCDELEARLKERSIVQGKFANSIVKNVAA
jgi:type I restriction enzyme, S subunit